MRRAHFVDPTSPRAVDASRPDPGEPLPGPARAADGRAAPGGLRGAPSGVRGPPVAAARSRQRAGRGDGGPPGRGGYGKTTLARALCHDETIQDAFHDGILWVTLGEQPGDLGTKVEDLIVALSGGPSSAWDAGGAQEPAAELLADRSLLLVIDDVWNRAIWTPFLVGGARCARLITTRNSETLPASTREVPVDAMGPAEAVALLRGRLPPGEDAALGSLARRLGRMAVASQAGERGAAGPMAGMHGTTSGALRARATAFWTGAGSRPSTPARPSSAHRRWPRRSA